MIKQYQQYPNQIPPKEQAQFSRNATDAADNASAISAQPAPIQEQIPPSSGILSPLQILAPVFFNY